MRYLLIAMLLLSGCAGLNMSDMTAAQIKATNGMASCGHSTNVYGKISIITANTDDVSKGANQKGRMSITCGDATMVIDNSVTLPK